LKKALVKKKTDQKSLEDKVAVGGKIERKRTHSGGRKKWKKKEGSFRKKGAKGFFLTTAAREMVWRRK